MNSRLRGSSNTIKDHFPKMLEEPLATAIITKSPTMFYISLNNQSWEDISFYEKNLGVRKNFSIIRLSYYHMIGVIRFLVKLAFKHAFVCLLQDSSLTIYSSVYMSKAVSVRPKYNQKACHRIFSIVPLYSSPYISISLKTKFSLWKKHNQKEVSQKNPRCEASQRKFISDIC